ncbi:lysophospholipase L1-like esterase [Sphingomonas sp. SORGH_AS870]|uniref:GDSL-type esterase/lipase family protein n=1 Tax=Sphingomonas sp. SORGH_AS_0870 TaxID=3041801 RepID=UPI00286670FE|nr:GDSL-type esterase/lipase family protein [Sphingomonas sp. SORGH_AS_0870]MDR6146739.1 lysophospholipase L1-like esterase [Sphingomonas sp. SORGH_AS_0870]
MVRLIKPEDPRTNVNFGALVPINNAKPLSAPVTLTGDSNIQYGPWQDVLTQRVDNHGIAGDTTSGLLIRLRTGEKSAGTVGIMIGINDPSAAITLAETEANFREILKLMGPRRIVVISPLVTAMAKRNSQIVAIRQAEQRLCASLPNCTFVNIGPSFETNGALRANYTHDGVHLSWSGYQKLGNILNKVLF